MYSVIKTADTSQPYVMEFVADTPEDIASIPTTYTPGSTIIVASDASVYMLNNKHEWVKL